MIQKTANSLTITNEDLTFKELKSLLLSIKNEDGFICNTYVTDCVLTKLPENEIWIENIEIQNSINILGFNIKVDPYTLTLFCGIPMRGGWITRCIFRN